MLDQSLGHWDKFLNQEESSILEFQGEFDEQEDWESYVARVKLFWRVTKVAEEDKTDQFLLFVGRNAFEKLTTLCAPAEPEDKPLQELIVLLGRY